MTMGVSAPMHSGASLYATFFNENTSAWSELIDITDMLHKLSLSLTLPVNPDWITSDANTRIALVLYDPSASARDKVVLNGLSQTSGITFTVYADDVAYPALPTTTIATTGQTVPLEGLRDTANQLVNFPLTNATCIAIELTYNANQPGDPADWPERITNGDFTQGDTAWSLTDDTNNTTVNVIYDQRLEIATQTTESTPQTLTITQQIAIDEDALFAHEFAFETVVFNAQGTGSNDASVEISLYRHDGQGGLPRLDYYQEILPTDPDALSYSGLVTPGYAGGYYELRIVVNNVTGLFVVGDFSLRLSPALTLFKAQAIDLRSIFWASPALVPESLGNNFVYGSPMDDGVNVKEQETTNTRHAHRVNSARTYQAKLVALTDASYRAFRYYINRFGDGYCLYQINTASTDPEDFFTARVRLSARDPVAPDSNRVTLTFSEVHEYL